MEGLCDFSKHKSTNMFLITCQRQKESIEIIYIYTYSKYSSKSLKSKRTTICIVSENTEWNFCQGLLLSSFLLPEMEVLLSSDQWQRSNSSTRWQAWRYIKKVNCSNFPCVSTQYRFFLGYNSRQFILKAPVVMIWSVSRFVRTKSLRSPLFAGVHVCVAHGSTTGLVQPSDAHFHLWSHGLSPSMQDFTISVSTIKDI